MIKNIYKYLSLESVSTWSKQIIYYSRNNSIFYKIQIIIFHDLHKAPFTIMPILIIFLFVLHIIFCNHLF
jgi:hypothetical protein